MSPLPATQNYGAFWFALALCDPNSALFDPCIPNSDANDPKKAGSAFLEMQFYPPGNPPFITQISCDLTRWCASLHITLGGEAQYGPPNLPWAFVTNSSGVQPTPCLGD